MIDDAAISNSHDWETLLTTIYVFISDHFEEALQFHCQRLNNNCFPAFSDEEALTIYIFGIFQKRTFLKDIYNFTKNYLKDWFPDMPSYPAFVNRINRLNNLFTVLSEILISDMLKSDPIHKTMLIDSMPIIVASAKRSHNAKAAFEIADKGFCSSKSMYYYGIKLHIIAKSVPDRLPIPIIFSITGGQEHDLTPLRMISEGLHDIDLFADKAYRDETDMRTFLSQHVTVFVP